MEHMILLWKGVVIVLICSIKPKIKLTVIVILGIIAAIIVSVIIYFNFKGETWVMVAGAQYSIQAGENEQRIDFLKQFGWEVEQEPVSIRKLSFLNSSIRCTNATMNYKKHKEWTLPNMQEKQ